MTIQLLAQQIPTWWQHISYAAIASDPLMPEEKIKDYLIDLLIDLEAGTRQAWITVENEEIHAVLITRIDKTKRPPFVGRLIVDVIYGFKPIEDKQEIVSTLVKFAKEIKLQTVMAVINNPIAANAAKKAGLTKSHEIYSTVVGG